MARQEGYPSSPEAFPDDDADDMADTELTDSPSQSNGNKGNRVVPTGLTNGCALVVLTQPATHSFPNTWQDVEVGVESAAGWSSPSASALHLTARVHHYIGGSVGEELASDQYVIDPSSTLQLPLRRSDDGDDPGNSDDRAKRSRHSTRIRFKIMSEPSEETPVRFCLQIGPRQDSDDEFLTKFKPTHTRPVQMVRAKLVVEANDWEKVWFKDEGGRDKCMQVQVTLNDKGGAPVYKRQLQLRLTLLYANDVKVMKQDTLRVLSPQSTYIDPNTAMTTLQFRIEDVSKNHQSNDFKVQISPESPFTADIGPCCTPRVVVRSKRNKRNRTSHSAASVPGPGPSPVPQASIPLPASRAVIPSPAPGVTDTGGMSSPPPGGLGPVENVEKLRHAMEGVIKWVEEVLADLGAMKWAHIGYANGPDGSPDLKRPHYSMDNPNDRIEKLFSSYSETSTHLRVLKAAVENTSSRPSQGTTLPSSALNNSNSRNYDMLGTSFGANPSDQMGLGGGSLGMANLGGRETHDGDMGGGNSNVLNSLIDPSNPRVPMGPSHASSVQSRSTAAALFGAASSPMYGWPGGRGGGMGPLMGGIGDLPDQLVGLQRDRLGDPFRRVDVQDGFGHNKQMEAEGQQETKYILAKEQKSPRTHDSLGLPVYDANKDVIGFIRVLNRPGQFTPIRSCVDDLNAADITKLRQMLLDAMRESPSSVKYRSDFNSYSEMMNKALVASFSNDIALNKGGMDGTDHVQGSLPSGWN